MNPLPVVGSRWRSAGLRHIWRVEKVTHRYVWLRPNFPSTDPLRCPVEHWPNGWKPA